MVAVFNFCRHRPLDFSPVAGKFRIGPGETCRMVTGFGKIVAFRALTVPGGAGRSAGRVMRGV
jgi:hypothetical protein